MGYSHLGQPDFTFRPPTDQFDPADEYRAYREIEQANTEEGKIKKFAKWAWDNKGAAVATVTGVWNYFFPGKDLAKTGQTTAQQTVGQSVQDKLSQAGVSLEGNQDAVIADLQAIGKKESAGSGILPIAVAALAIGVLFGGRR